jgi:membrane protein
VLAASFNAFILSGRTYETIYGAVVAVPVFLVWIYTSWMVIIYGAVVAASLPDWRATGEAGVPLDAGPTGRLELALRLLADLYRQSRTGGTIPEADLTGARPSVATQEVLDDLRDAGYIVTAEDGGVSLARDLHIATVSDLAADILVAHCRAAVRANVTLAETVEADHDHVDRLLARLNAAEQEVLGIPLARVFDEPTAGGTFKTPPDRA